MKKSILSKELSKCLPPGHFRRFVTSSDAYIYMYVHYVQEACGKVDGEVHNLFYHIDYVRPLMSDAQIFEFLGNSPRFGYSFLQRTEDNQHIQFEVTDEAATLTLVRPFSTDNVQPECNPLLERVRGESLARVLQPKVEASGLTFHRSMEGYEDYSQFTGGGDFYISSSNCVLAIHINDLGCEDTQDLGVAPLITAIEMKHISGKPQREINKQLRANMVAALTHHYCRQLIKQCTTNSRPFINTLTAYGITFGTVSNVVVYKLEMDFDAHTCSFIELFQRPQSDFLGALFIDAALLYVIKKMAPNSLL